MLLSVCLVFLFFFVLTCFIFSNLYSLQFHPATTYCYSFYWTYAASFHLSSFFIKVLF